MDYGLEALLHISNVLLGFVHAVFDPVLFLLQYVAAEVLAALPYALGSVAVAALFCLPVLLYVGLHRGVWPWSKSGKK